MVIEYDTPLWPSKCAIHFRSDWYRVPGTWYLVLFLGMKINESPSLLLLFLPLFLFLPPFLLIAILLPIRSRGT